MFVLTSPGAHTLNAGTEKMLARARAHSLVQTAIDIKHPLDGLVG